MVKLIRIYGQVKNAVADAMAPIGNQGICSHHKEKKQDRSQPW